ncbi:MAG: protein kinase [Planctomycetaceae bacterium]|jgi:serine/threonine protein kinase|nr:protein kinase [Planctomycetaceae bacterium]
MQPGQLILGEFLLQRLVSNYQTGEVWRALEVRVGRLVLLHFIPEPFRANGAAMQRLRRHFIALRQWRHPHIVLVDRLVEQSECGAFFVSRFVEGPLLNEYAAQWIQAEGRFPFHLIFDILRPVAVALDEAGTQNLAHRSLSHRMIVVSPTEGIQIQGFDLPGIIREGLNIPDDFETIRYLAPEQILNRKAGVLSDQYALAMIVAELLANKVLFTADNIEELRTKILTTQPPLLQNYCESVNASLQRALHRDPSVRFPSCIHFLDGLSGSMVVDFPPSYAVPVQGVQSSVVQLELLDSIYTLSVSQTANSLTKNSSTASSTGLLTASSTGSPTGSTIRSSTSSSTVLSTNSVLENRISVWEMISERLVSFKKIAAASQSANAEKIAAKIRKEHRIRFLSYFWIFVLFISLLAGFYALLRFKPIFF